MLSKEREERKKRKDSTTNLTDEDPKDLAEDGKKEDNKADDEEFSKPMMYLFDDNELKERKREQMFGNMYLITELYIAK